MNKGIEFIVGIVVTVILLVGLVGGSLIGIFLYISYQSQKTVQWQQQATVDGRKLRETTDQNGCMEKGLSLAPEKYGDSSHIVSFVETCLKSSRPVADFCDGVPIYNDWEARKKWEAAQNCEKSLHRDSCDVTVSAKLNYCDDKKRRTL